MKRHKRNSKPKQRQKSPRRNTGRKKLSAARRVLTKRGGRRMLMFSNGKAFNVTVSHKTSTKIGQYFAEVKQFFEDQDLIRLYLYIGEFITDLRGRKYQFEVRPNHIYRLALAKARS